MADRLIYFADPMCSWCWGFAPVIEHIRNTYTDRMELITILGGLRPFTEEAMDEETKQEVRSHWEHVQQASGQPFDWSFFERETFVYDTEPACRAVVTARRQDDAAGLSMLERLHRAFYAENTDVTDGEILATLAGEIGLDRARFSEDLESDDAKQETMANFALAQKVGITGFPTLLAGNDDSGYGIVTQGFRPQEDVTAIIDQWLEGQLTVGDAS